MSRVLEDPSDDTKGFFDPNTHENLTYIQLMDRCIEDPDTGLLLVPVDGENHDKVMSVSFLLMVLRFLWERIYFVE